MKKFLSLIGVVVMGIALLTGCGASDEPVDGVQDDTNLTVPGSTEPQDTPADNTEGGNSDAEEGAADEGNAAQ